MCWTMTSDAGAAPAEASWPMRATTALSPAARGRAFSRAASSRASRGGGGPPTAGVGDAGPDQGQLVVVVLGAAAVADGGAVHDQGVEGRRGRRAGAGTGPPRPQHPPLQPVLAVAAGAQRQQVQALARLG